MSKVQTKYRLSRPLDDAALEAIAKATSIYGIYAVKLSPSLDSVTVEYDASRLMPAHVPPALAGVGLPVAGPS